MGRDKEDRYKRDERVREAAQTAYEHLSSEIPFNSAKELYCGKKGPGLVSRYVHRKEPNSRWDEELLLTLMQDALQVDREVRQAARELYGRADGCEELPQTDSTRVRVASCYYLVMRDREMPVPLQEIGDRCWIETKRISRQGRKVYREFSNDIDMSPPPLEAYVERYVSELPVDSDQKFSSKDRVGRRANRIAEYVEDNEIAIEHANRIRAAGIVYIAQILEGMSLTQRDVASTVGVADSTISKVYKKLISPDNPKSMMAVGTPDTKS